MAGRLTKAEEELKANALWMVYEEYKAKGHDIPSQDDITKTANEREEIKACKYPIGAKTLAQSNNPRIKELRELLTYNRKKVSGLKAIAPTELSIKIEQLHSSLAENSKFALKIENLLARLKNKDDALEEKETRIIELSNEIRRLRN